MLFVGGNSLRNVRSLVEEDTSSLAPIAPNSASSSSSSLDSASRAFPPKAKDRLGLDDNPQYAPYADDPERGPDHDPHTMLQTQRQMMDGGPLPCNATEYPAYIVHLLPDQDVHLDQLSRSINRQRDLSMQIGDELDTHTVCQNTSTIILVLLGCRVNANDVDRACSKN